jgi:Group II intron, maturase-specific domain
VIRPRVYPCDAVCAREGVTVRTNFAEITSVSPQALKEMGRQLRRWRIHRRTRLDLNELAAAINPIVVGWMNYYGRFYGRSLAPSSPASTPT